MSGLTRYAKDVSRLKPYSRIIQRAIRKLVGGNLKRYREEKNITQDELWRMIRIGGKSRQWVQEIESGNAGFSLGSLYTFCAVLNVEMADVLPSVEWVFKEAGLEVRQVVINRVFVKDEIPEEGSADE